MVEEDAPSRAAASRAAASPEEEEASPEEEEAFPEEEEAFPEEEEALLVVVMVLVRAAETNASAVAYLLPWAAAAEAAEEAAAGEVL